MSLIIDNIKQLLRKTHNIKKFIQQPNYYVIAYLLNQDITNYSDLYGCIIPLGIFNTRELAEEHVLALSLECTYQFLLICHYGEVVLLRQNPTSYQEILVDKESKKIVHNSSNMQSVKQELQILAKEYDNTSYEYYALKCKQCIECMSNIDNLHNELLQAEENYKLQLQEIKQLNNPEFKNKWLNSELPVQYQDYQSRLF